MYQKVWMFNFDLAVIYMCSVKDNNHKNTTWEVQIYRILCHQHCWSWHKNPIRILIQRYVMISVEKLCDFHSGDNLHIAVTAWDSGLKNIRFVTWPAFRRQSYWKPCGSTCQSGQKAIVWGCDCQLCIHEIVRMGSHVICSVTLRWMRVLIHY